MKIFVYGLRDDERPFLDEWLNEHTEVEVESTSELLDSQTIDFAKNADGIVAYQQKPYEEAVFTKMNEYGIHALSLRNVGIDNLPIDSLNANQIKLSNVPAYSPNAVAELSVTQLLALLRKIPDFEEKMAHGNYRWEPDIGLELDQMTVGIIGTGRIGRVAINIFKGFGAKVVCFDVFRNPEIEKEGLYVDSLDELYQKADVVTLHVPALEDNYHMINQESIAKMKDGVFILNYSRGSLVSTPDLINALDSGKVAGAGLDTYEEEVGIFDVDHSKNPITDQQFLNLANRNNVMITPHTAFYTKRAVKNMVQIALTNNLDLIQKGVSENQIEI